MEAQRKYFIIMFIYTTRDLIGVIFIIVFILYNTKLYIVDTLIKWYLVFIKGNKLYCYVEYSYYTLSIDRTKYIYALNDEELKEILMGMGVDKLDSLKCVYPSKFKKNMKTNL